MILQGYDIVPVINATSFVADFTDDYSAVTFAIAYNVTNQSVYYITSRSLWTVDRLGNAAKLGSFNSYIEVELQPTIIGQHLVIVDTYYGKVYVYDSVRQSLRSGVDACYAARSVQPIVTGTKFIFFCSSQNSYGSTAANLVDMTTGRLDNGFLPKSSSSYPYGLGGAVVDGGKTLILATSVYELRAFDISKSPASTTTALWTLSRSLGTTSGFLSLTSLPVVYRSKFYFTAMGYVYMSAAGSQSTLFSVPATGLVSSVSLTTELVLGRTNSDAVFKTLLLGTGGGFGGDVLYIVGSANITAVVTLSKSPSVCFNYRHNGTIMSTMQGTPALLKSGMMCFFDSNSNFVAVDGLSGRLAWTYPTLASNWYAPQSDGVNVYFSDGYHVVGADEQSGAVSSVATYGTGGGVQGFALAPGVNANASTVVAATNSRTCTPCRCLVKPNSLNWI